MEEKNHESYKDKVVEYVDKAKEYVGSLPAYLKESKDDVDAAIYKLKNICSSIEVDGGVARDGRADGTLPGQPSEGVRSKEKEVRTPATNDFDEGYKKGREDKEKEISKVVEEEIGGYSGEGDDKPRETGEGKVITTSSSESASAQPSPSSERNGDDLLGNAYRGVAHEIHYIPTSPLPYWQDLSLFLIKSFLIFGAILLALVVWSKWF